MWWCALWCWWEWGCWWWWCRGEMEEVLELEPAALPVGVSVGVRKPVGTGTNEKEKGEAEEDEAADGALSREDGEMLDGVEALEETDEPRDSEGAITLEPAGR